MISLKTLAAAAMAAAAISTGSAEARNLIGVGIAGSDDHVYYWYSDGKASAGVTGQPTHYRSYYPVQSTEWGQLLAVDIAGNDRAWYWWQLQDDIIIVTSGTTDRPALHKTDWNFFEMPYHALIAAGIAKSDDHVYYYWKHKTTGAVSVSSGTSIYPTAYRPLAPLQAATTMMTHDLLDVSIAGDDRVYYWWRRKSDGVITITAGTTVDPFKYRGNHYSSGL
jgi:hypothetical protein